MRTTVKLNNGQELEAYKVSWFSRPAQLHIYPIDMSLAEIEETFDNPEATKTITVITEKESPSGEPTRDERVFNGYTVLFSIQRSMLNPDAKEYMVWLQLNVLY